MSSGVVLWRSTSNKKARAHRPKFARAFSSERLAVTIHEKTSNRQAEFRDLSELLGDGPSNVAALSALDQPIRFTYSNRYHQGSDDYGVESRNQSLRRFADSLKAGKFRKAEKQYLRMVKLADMSGATRDSVTYFSGVMGDYDAGEITKEQAADRLRKASMAAVFYDSPSHTVDHPRWRVLAPAIGTMDAEAMRGCLDRLNGALGGILAPESWDDFRRYHYGNESGVLGVITVDGRAIDKATLPSGIEPIRHERASATANPKPDPAPVQESATGWQTQFVRDWLIADTESRLVPLKRGDGRQNMVRQRLAYLAGAYGAQHCITEDEAREIIHDGWLRMGDLPDGHGKEFKAAFRQGWRDGLRDRPVAAPRDYTDDFDDDIGGNPTPAEGIDSDGLLILDDPKPQKLVISPTAFRLPDEREIPPREWLYGHHLIRKYASGTLAPGGAGKSTLTITEAVAMAAGKPLMGVKPHGKLRVWLWNGEDPLDELSRRIAATCSHHSITQADLGDRLLVDSGRTLPIKIGRMDKKAGATIATPVVDGLVAAIRQHKIDVLVIDPFISAYGLPENDNEAMDAAVKAFALVADRTGCAIDLIHHTRKLNGAEADIDAARGGSAFAAAIRSGRALNVMSKDEAKKLGIYETERRSYVRIDDAKANLAPPEAANWMRIVGQWLDNATDARPADHVGVATAWEPPALDEMCSPAQFEQIAIELAGKNYRANSQAGNWCGHVIASVLDLDVDEQKGTISRLVKDWIKSGRLIERKEHDARNGREVTVIDVPDDEF